MKTTIRQYVTTLFSSACQLTEGQEDFWIGKMGGFRLKDGVVRFFYRDVEALIIQRARRGAAYWTAIVVVGVILLILLLIAPFLTLLLGSISVVGILADYGAGARGRLYVKTASATWQVPGRWRESVLGKAILRLEPRILAAQTDLARELDAETQSEEASKESGAETSIAGEGAA